MKIKLVLFLNIIIIVETLLESIRDALKVRGITHVLLQPETLKYATHTTLCTAHHY